MCIKMIIFPDLCMYRKTAQKFLPFLKFHKINVCYFNPTQTGLFRIWGNFLIDISADIYEIWKSFLICNSFTTILIHKPISGDVAGSTPAQIKKTSTWWCHTSYVTSYVTSISHNFVKNDPILIFFFHQKFKCHWVAPECTWVTNMLFQRMGP